MIALPSASDAALILTTAASTAAESPDALAELTGPRGFLRGEHSLREKDMSKFQISPNVQIVVGAIVAVLTLGSKGAIQLPAGIPASWGPIIDSWSTFILQIYSVIAPIMLAYTSSAPGPLAPPDSPAVKAAMAKDSLATKAASGVVGALLIGLLALGAWSIVSPIAARAANAGADEVKVANGPVVRPPSPFTPSAPTPAAGDAAGPLSDLADLFASDFAGAASLATETSIKDGNGQACWTAFGPFGELVKAHPHVFTGKLATDLEAQRLLVMNARKLCDNVACQTVFTEAATAISKVTSVLPVSINVNVTPVNLFAKACADVPNIAVVAPTVEPTPTPTVSPTPTPSATGG